MIPAPVRARLAKMIRMLGSTEMGDVLAAARAMQTTLKANGFDLHDLADEIEQTAGAVYKPDDRARGGWDRTKRQAALEALQWGLRAGRIRDGRELEFVNSIIDRMIYRPNRSLSPAQERWIAQIIERLKKPERTYSWDDVA